MSNSYVAAEQQPSALVTLSQSLVFPDEQRRPGAEATSRRQKKPQSLYRISNVLVNWKLQWSLFASAINTELKYTTLSLFVSFRALFHCPECLYYICTVPIYMLTVNTLLRSKVRSLCVPEPLHFSLHRDLALDNYELDKSEPSYN